MVAPVYAKGLRFSCARCSACCRGEPGYVFLSRADLGRLLKRLGLDFKSFYREYCTLVDVGTGMALSLREVRRGDGSLDCALWRPEGCGVYEDRPVQCSTYPFWPSVLESARSWRDEASSCPGIGAGEALPREAIEERLLARREAAALVLGYGVDPEGADEAAILGR